MLRFTTNPAPGRWSMPLESVSQDQLQSGVRLTLGSLFRPVLLPSDPELMLSQLGAPARRSLAGWTLEDDWILELSPELNVYELSCDAQGERPAVRVSQEQWKRLAQIIGGIIASGPRTVSWAQLQQACQHLDEPLHQRSEKISRLLSRSEAT